MGSTLIGQLEESATKLEEKATAMQALIKKKKNKHKYYAEHVKQAYAQFTSYVSLAPAYLTCLPGGDLAERSQGKD